MHYRTLGASGLRLSEISLGSWLTFGAELQDAASFKILQAALDAGVNFIDTADVYNRGEAEEAIGRFLKKADRTHIVLGTKAFFPMSDHWMDQGLSQRYLQNACEASLRRLQTDYIDLYQCHRYDPATPMEETCYAMHNLIERGLVRYWGVSQWTAVQITNALRLCERNGWRKPVSNQPIYNMLNRSLEVDVMEVCETEGVGLVVYSPLAQGVLSGKYAPGQTPADSRAAKADTRDWFSHKRLTEENLEKVEALKAVAADLNCSIAQLALAWCLRKQPLTCVITGASRLEQLLENVRAGEFAINEETETRIEEILQNAPTDQYTGNRIGHGA